MTTNKNSSTESNPVPATMAQKAAADIRALGMSEKETKSRITKVANLAFKHFQLTKSLNATTEARKAIAKMEEVDERLCITAPNTDEISGILYDKSRQTYRKILTVEDEIDQLTKP